MTIRDLGYKRYDGPRLPHRSRYGVLLNRTLASAWSSGLVKTTIILGSFPMVVCGVVIFFKTQAMSFISQSGVPIQMEDPGRWVFYCLYWCQLWFAFALSLLVAAPTISEDVRTGAFQFYFARPVSRSHYLWGKMLPVAILALALTLGPALLLSVLRIALVKNAGEAATHSTLIFASLIYAPIFAAVIALPPIAMSSLTRRTGTVQGLWSALFFFSWILGEGMAAATGAEAVALISIPTDLRLVGQYFFGIEPSYALPVYQPMLVLLGVVVGLVMLVLHRLGRVEVFG